MLGRRHVFPSVVTSLVELQIEGTFVTGTYLVTVHNPISSDDGDLEKALYGSFLPIPSLDKFPLPEGDVYAAEKQPGAIIPVKEGRIVLNEGRKRIQLKVVSKGDRPIQVSKLGVIDMARVRTDRIDRSDRTTISLRRTRSWSLTEFAHTGIILTLQLERPFVSSLAIQRPSILFKSQETNWSKAAMDWLQAVSMTKLSQPI